jgi:hypothetical protein
MKTEQVRCWKVGVNRELFITYPDGDMGHRLICCISCGRVHAVNVAKQLYIEPDLERRLHSVQCDKCGKLLAGNWAYYPEKYVGEGGQLWSYERPCQIPNDADSIVAEFPEVFS